MNSRAMASQVNGGMDTYSEAISPRWGAGIRAAVAEFYQTFEAFEKVFEPKPIERAIRRCSPERMAEVVRFELGSRLGVDSVKLLIGDPSQSLHELSPSNEVRFSPARPRRSARRRRNAAKRVD